MPVRSLTRGCSGLPARCASPPRPARLAATPGARSRAPGHRRPVPLPARPRRAGSRAPLRNEASQQPRSPARREPVPAPPAAPRSACDAGAPCGWVGGPERPGTAGWRARRAWAGPVARARMLMDDSQSRRRPASLLPSQPRSPSRDRSRGRSPPPPPALSAWLGGAAALPPGPPACRDWPVASNERPARFRCRRPLAAAHRPRPPRPPPPQPPRPGIRSAVQL